MSITFERTNLDARQRAIWRGEAKMLPGGFKPLQDFPVGTLLKRGTLVHVDTDTLSAAIVKVAKVVDGGTTKAPRVQKGNNYTVGDTIMKLGTTSTATISAIDTTNEGYDTLTLSAAITGLAGGDFLQEADTSGSTPAAKYEPNAVLGEDKQFIKGDIPALDVAWGALVLKNVIPAFPEDYLDGGICLKGNHNILFINQ